MDKYLLNNGYLIKKNIIDKDFCKDCINYLENDFEGTKLIMPHTDIPYFYTDFKKNSIVYKILENETIKKVVTNVLGEDYKLLWFKIFNKIKFIGQDVEYHQEIIYNQNSNIKSNDSFQLFLSLDNHNLENGCLKIVPNSSKNILKHDEFVDRNGDHKYRVNCDVLTEEINKNGIVNCIFEPGDCIFFEDTIPHGSASNASQNDRYGVSISFIKKSVKIDTKLRDEKYKERRDKSKNYLNELISNINKKKTPKIFVNS
jgi:ectoine hydroxylase-related dioxygenase (phytanoyl-CoA dioxygenase family)